MEKEFEFGTVYTSNSRFQFNSKTFFLNHDTFKSFNLSYQMAKELSDMLPRKELDQCYADCLQNLNLIFSDFQREANEGLEKIFLKELKSEVERLLNEQFDYYSMRKNFKLANLNQKVASTILSYNENRYFLGKLSSGAISKIQRISKETIDVFRARAKEGRLTREDLSEGSGPVIQEIVAILNQEFQDCGVLQAASSYLKMPMQVTGAGLELSVENSNWWNSQDSFEIEPRTLYAHLDESIQFPKAIVYVSDVNEENGATSFYPQLYEQLDLNPLQELIGRVIGIPGSSKDSPLRSYYNKKYHQAFSSQNFINHFMKLPKELRFNSHFGWDLIKHSDLEEQMVRIERKLIGEAGTFIAFDGAKLVHRGGLVQAGERIALQVIFGPADKKLSLDKRLIRKLKHIVSKI